MQKAITASMIAVGSFFGFSHGLYLRHKYIEEDLGLKFADGVSSMGKQVGDTYTQNTKDLKIQENYEAMITKGKDAVVAATGGQVQQGQHVQGVESQGPKE